MKKTSLVLFSVLGFLLSAYILAGLWDENPDSRPRHPESFWRFINYFYTPGCCEEQAYMEFTVYFVEVLIIQSLLFLALRFLWRRIKAR